LLLGKAALWRAPDSVDASPVHIHSNIELQFRGIEEEAESLVKLLRRKYGMKLSYDEDSLRKLDDIIDSEVKPPVSKDRLGMAVVPWDSFLTKGVAVVFSGEFVKDPANGVKVRIRTPKGVVETSPSNRMWSRLEQGRNDRTSITRYIEELRRKADGD
jgi:hypothetical protein